MSSTRTPTSEAPARAEFSDAEVLPYLGSERAGDGGRTDLPSSGSGPQWPAGAWRLAACAVLALAAALRLWNLEQTPLHNDEGVNAFFLMRLFHEGYYHYDPVNYHGPTLYYFALPLVYLFGLNTTALRLETALAGVLTVAGLLCLRPRLGRSGALAAALLLAASPGAVYFSRCFIHETLVAALTLGVVLAALRFAGGGRPRDLLLGCAAAALLFATKETAGVTVAVLALAAAGTRLWLRPAQGGAALSGTERARLRTLGLWAPSAVSLFLLVAALLYSSFGSRPSGPGDAVRALSVWAGTAARTQGHPWDQYLVWLWRGDPVLLVVGAAGALWALCCPDDARPGGGVTVFCALWAFGALAAYSLVSYKTPWLALNVLLPLAVTGGHGVAAALRWGRSRGPGQSELVAGLACAAVAVSLCQAVRLSFFRYDDEREAYVYVHTRRDLLRLVADVDRLGAAAGDASVLVTAPDYWPLPWYLRDDRSVGYLGRVAPPAGQALVLGSEEQAAALATALGSRYRRVGDYGLRPGVTLVLFARRISPAPPARHRGITLWMAPAAGPP